MEQQNEIVIHPQSTTHLPSTEVREIMPLIEEEIHLKDYLDVILRRKWSVIITILVTFISCAIFTFSSTPLFLAKGVMKASPQGLKVTNFDNNADSFLKSIEFLQTQVELLQSERVLAKVINGLELAKNADFNPNVQQEDEATGGLKGVLLAIKDMIRPEKDSQASGVLSEELEKELLHERLLNTFRASLRVQPKKNTQLVEIFFESPSPRLSAAVANSVMDKFLETQMETKVASFRTADVFLAKQIEGARIKLEKSEQLLNEFARHTGIISLDSKSNLIMRQLEETNEALVKAVTLRIHKESLYEQTLKVGGENLPQILDNQLIQSLKTQHAGLLAEYQDLGTVFKDGYPEMQKLKARMTDIEGRIQLEVNRVVDSIKNQYESALENEKILNENAVHHKELAMGLNDKATQYKILQREVETNKDIYNSLLGRSKEIEASIGADIGNIEIVDNARVPALPYKPKIMRNLLFGILLGVFGGFGLAFGLEYMDNTVKNPEEFPRRYHIPVLGLLPFNQDSAGSDKDVALTYFNDPRAPLSEAIRTAMVSIELSSAERPPKTILITSVLPDAGKSTVSSNYSLSLLPSASSVLLIDTDLRKPTLHKIFGDDRGNTRGLSNYLTGTAKLEEVVQQTEFDKLFFIPSGPIPPNPAELLASKRMRDFIQIASKKFEYIIIDAPPFHGFAEILILSNMVDGVILVAELNRTPREGIQYFNKAVTNVGGHILGTLINKVDQKGGYGYYGGYKYYAQNYEYGRDQR